MSVKIYEMPVQLWHPHCTLYIVQALYNVTYTIHRTGNVQCHVHWKSGIDISQVIKTFYLNLASIYLKIHGHMDTIFKQNKFTQLTRYTFHRTTDHRQGPPRRPRYIPRRYQVAFGQPLPWDRPDGAPVISPQELDRACFSNLLWEWERQPSSPTWTEHYLAFTASKSMKRIIIFTLGCFYTRLESIFITLWRE